MVKMRRFTVALLLLLFIVWVQEPVGRNTQAIYVDDGTVVDWAGAQVALPDPVGDSPNDMTDLTFVAFDFDDTWFYVRWDIDNDTYSPAVLYDMGINTTATGSFWDMYVSAQIELIGGVPEITNISIRNADDIHIWNASDDGNMTEDGSLYIDPAPGSYPGNHSTEARFPLASIGIPYGVIFGQFRSHASTSVNSNVKDKVPDSGYIVLSIDDNPPILDNLYDFPDPQDAGGNVNITVDATDDFGVNMVFVNITCPNGSWVNTSMVKGIGNQRFSDMIYFLPGLYTYTVWANDSSGNWNSTGPGTFVMLDIESPEIIDIDDSPDPQIYGGSVNITAEIFDDIGVDSVWVNITYPDSSWANSSMNRGSGIEWFFETTYSTAGIHSYTVWTNDTSNNWNASGPGTFLIQGVGLPELDNLTADPNPQENGGEINITVDVTDPDGLGGVWVNITFPDGSSINVSMDSGGGNDWFQNTTYGDVGVYTFTIYANDTLGNWNSAGPESFSIIDTDAPEFLDAADTPDPQENGGFVNVTVQVIDDVGVDGVWIVVINPDSSVANNSMFAGIGYEWFFEARYDILGVYSYTVWTVDIVGNWNATIPETFTIIDTDPPEFENLVVAPNPQENGGTATVTVDITDDVGVAGVWINVTNPDGTWSNNTMSSGPGARFGFDSIFTILGNYHYEIWAVDTSGNWNKTGPDVFVIRDTDSPEIGEPTATPEEQEEGGKVNITVDVTDDVGIEEVWIAIILPDGTSLNVSMTQGANDQWYFEDEFDSPGEYSYTIWASDESGNWNTRGPENFSIVTPESPQEPPEEPEEKPDLHHMIMLLFFWPLFLILITAMVVRMYGFDNRFKRQLIKTTPEFIKNFETLHHNGPDMNQKAMEEIVLLCLKAGIPVEEFILALQGAWSSGQVDAAQPGFLNDDIMALFVSLVGRFDRTKRQ